MKSVDISGMGGGYEATCQVMLIAGMKWLKEHPDFSFEGYKSYDNVYGIVETPDTKLAKELDDVLGEASNHDMTGAQHQAVLSHLHFIHCNGEEKWIEELKAAGREIIEVDEADITKQIEEERKAWEAKLASGYNPLEEILKKIPKDQVVYYDPENPKEAAEKLASLLEEKEK